MKLIKPVLNYCLLLTALVFFVEGWNVSAKADSIRMFDEYGNLSFKDEKARLNNLAQYMLQEEPTFIAYIIAYNGRKSCRNEAQLRAQRAESYLISKHKISGERVKIIDGGYREKLTFEFYVFPKDVAVPKGSATLEASEVKITGDCKQLDKK